MELKAKVKELEVRNANQRETIISRTSTEPSRTEIAVRILESRGTSTSQTYKERAEFAVKQTDALLEELNKPKTT